MSFGKQTFKGKTSDSGSIKGLSQRSVYTALNTVSFTVKQTSCWVREHKYFMAVQSRAGVGFGPCEDKDESTVEMTQYTEYTEPNYRYCNSGNLLQWATGVKMGRR